MRHTKKPMSSNRAKELRDECLSDLEQARGTAYYPAILKRLLNLTNIIVAAETREADERSARKAV